MWSPIKWKNTSDTLEIKDSDGVTLLKVHLYPYTSYMDDINKLELYILNFILWFVIIASIYVVFFCNVCFH